MRRFKETTKCVVTALAFCFLFMVSMLAEAATYKPGVTYVDPEVNSKNEYYSVLKKRMPTYSEDGIEVINPTRRRYRQLLSVRLTRVYGRKMQEFM